jgi:hypothetical protein
MIILIQLSLLWVFWGEPRTIISKQNIFNTTRIEQYFSSRIMIKDHYMNAANFIEQKGCENIGVSFRPEAWEYPFWKLLEKNGNKNIHFEHVNIKNPSQIKSNVYPFKNFIPCAILSVGSVQGDRINIKEGVYVREWQSVESSDPVQVFIRQSVNTSNDRIP